MPNYLKALVVVMAIAAAVLHVAKPIALQFMSSEDFLRRKQVWFALTVICFVMPNIWLYSLFAVPVLLWAANRDSNPIALYLWLLHVIPPVTVTIPLPGTSGLLPLDNNLLLSVCILLPTATRNRKRLPTATRFRFGAMEILLLAFGFLQIVLYTSPDIPGHVMLHDTPLNIVRRTTLFYLETYLLYLTVVQTCESKRMMLDVAACIALGCGVIAAIALFENLKGWLLYVDIAGQWGNDSSATYYLVRGGSVRAQVSAGHSIALGNILAVGFAFWLYVRAQVQSSKLRIGMTLLLCAGLYATSSRGAWVGTAIIYFTFLAAGPRPLARLAKGAIIAAVCGALVMASPLSERIISMLPKKGQPADVYRQHLAERGWELVLSHPFFGHHFPWPEMEDLRQGEGIIDIVNTYLGISLNYGFVGLFCFLGFILLGLKHVFERNRKLLHDDPDTALLGSSLIACIVGILIMINSNSFPLGCEKYFYTLAGLTTAYAFVDKSTHKNQPLAASATA